MLAKLTTFLNNEDSVTAVRISWQRKFFRLWLVGTLVLLLGTGLVLRPDRDLAQYLKHQHVESDESDLQFRRLAPHIRSLRGKGLTLDQIKSELLSNGALTDEVLTGMIELDAALRARDQAKERLALFAAIILLTPLIILELGAVLICARRGYKVWTKVLRKICGRTVGAGIGNDN